MTSQYAPLEAVSYLYSCNYHATDSCTEDKVKHRCRNAASVILSCDSPFTGLCSANQADCLQVQGPSMPQIESLSVPFSLVNSLQAEIAWEVRLTIALARCFLDRLQHRY